MNKQEYFEFAERFFSDCVETSRKKNADYTGGSQDPFSNFTSIESLGIKTEIGFLTRMMDKMKRIASYVENGELQVKDESVMDTLKDLANYSCLLAGYIKSQSAPNFTPDFTKLPLFSGLNNRTDIPNNVTIPSKNI